MRAWAFIVLLAVSGCSQHPQSTSTSPVSQSAIPASEDVVAVPTDLLTEEQLKAESTKAVEGDAAAAERVASYYAFTDPQNKDTDFWIRVAVENGSALWIDAYAQQLAALGGEEKCRRALYWMRRSAAEHSDQSAKIERRMDEINAHPGCQVSGSLQSRPTLQ